LRLRTRFHGAQDSPRLFRPSQTNFIGSPLHYVFTQRPGARFASWLGYSTAHWDGDALVVESNGYNDKQGLPGGQLDSEKIRFRERFTRIDFGHMDMEPAPPQPGR
jgi:hypothetical protein